MDKLSRLKKIISDMGEVTVAFSGGMDSALLAKVAYDVLDDKATAITARTDFVPEEDIEKAVLKAGKIGIRHSVIQIGIMDPGIVSNPANRCYLCKRKILEAIKAKNLVDGTNAEDDCARPGLRALSELGIRSPLKEANLWKKDIEKYSGMLSLPVEPSNSCLATRIPQGEEITAEKLHQVEMMEKFLHENNIIDVRARHMGDFFRIELHPKDFNRFREIHEQAVETAKNLGMGVEIGER